MKSGIRSNQEVMFPRTINRLVFAWGLWLGLAGAAPVGQAGPEEVPRSEDYVLRVWETDDGLPQNSVTGLAQTPDGYLWVATQGGLARFDGVRFTTFLKGNTPGLESSYSRSLATDRSGALWIGLERGGVARMKDGKFETILPVAPPTTLTRWASSFAEDAEGAVWIGMAPDQCLYRWRDGQLTKFTSDDGIGAGDDTFVHADIEGRIWYATKKTCGIFDGTRFQPIDPQGGERVHLARSQAGGMWATRGESLVRYFADGRREEVADLSWLGGAVEINALFEDRAGDLWLGTRGAGLVHFHRGNFSRVAASHQAVLTIFGGREGSLWTGTIGGLNRLRPQRFFLRGAQHGLAKEGVLSLGEDTDGHLWLVVRDSAPVRAVDATNQSFVAPEGWPGGVTSTMSPDPSGGVWFGYGGGSLLRWRDGVYSRVESTEPVATILCDHTGSVWMATDRGSLIEVRDGVETPEPTVGGLVLVRALAEDGAGAIWAGTDDGQVFRWEHGRFVRVPLPGARGGESIRFLVADGPDTMWIGAREGGLLRWRAGRVDRLSASGMPAHDLRALVIEPNGRFWLAMSGGLFLTTRRDLEEMLAGRERLLRGTSYGRDDGMPKLGFVFGRRNSATRTRDGRLWFATDRGALEVSPEPLPGSAPLFPVIVEEMQVDDEPVPLAKGTRLVLPPKPGPIEIRYTAPRLNAPERLRFRYRLAGLEKEWTPAQNGRLATYARLPPGNYRFQVAVSEGEGVESADSMDALDFTVRAAWWETTIFRAAVGLLGAGVLAALVRMIVLRRVRRRIALLEQQHALEKERARIARDMHDDLGASLTRIALLSELAADEPEMQGAAAGQLEEIAQAARSVSGTLDQIVWTVNPRNDTLERLVGYLGEFAGEYLAPSGLDFRLELPMDIPAQPVLAEARHAVLLAVKETLNNIVKHAQARTVTLRVAIEGAVLRITVADDGCGFDPAKTSAFSNGLTNLQQRLGAVGGSAEIEAQPGTGTAVILRLAIGPP